MLFCMRPPFLLFLFLLIQSSGIVVGQSPLLEGIEHRHGLTGISVVTRCGHTVSAEYHAGYGNIALNTPVDAKTAFRVASISKAVVALIAAKLNAQGHLDVDAPLESYLGSRIRHPHFPDRPLTLRMFLSHTAGIRDGSGYDAFLKETYAQAPNVPLLTAALTAGGAHFHEDVWANDEPGTYFHYANLNFGVVATVLEASTGKRFDRLVKELLLEPYGLEGGFQRQDLSLDLSLATLYRQQGGEWVPQADDILDADAPQPDWNGYIPGTNALGFAPQGGLRTSARSLAILAQLWTCGVAQSPKGTLQFLPPHDLLMLQTPEWAFNGSNGDPYHGLFNQWSAGLHLASSGLGDDTLIPDVDMAPFVGHAGEAYGLISDAYATTDGRWSMAFVTNGKWDGYSTGSNSAFYAVEEEVFSALRIDLLQCLAREEQDIAGPSWSVTGSPSAGDTLLYLQGASQSESPLIIDWHVAGRPSKLGCIAAPIDDGRWQLAVSPMPAGTHQMVAYTEEHPNGVPLVVWIAP